MSFFLSKSAWPYALIALAFLAVSGFMLVATLRQSPEVSEQYFERVDTVDETREIETTSPDRYSQEEVSAIDEEITLATEAVPEQTFPL